MNAKKYLSAMYDAAVLSKLGKIGRICNRAGGSAYLVGGPVRDAMLGGKTKDADIAVEHPEPLRIAGAAASVLGGRKCSVRKHGRFGTASISLGKGRGIREFDLAMTREEVYGSPGALPRVRYAGIGKDLARRDFTVNAMAVSINRNNFGELIDPFGGMRDLKKKMIGVLHADSFRDDPTRIFRAARFAGRLSMKLSSKTSKLLAEAAQREYAAGISNERISNELMHILREKKAEACLKLLVKWNMFRYVPGTGVPGKWELALMRKDPGSIDPAVVRLCALVYRRGTKMSAVKKRLKDLRLKRTVQNGICAVIDYINGGGGKLPAWSEDFFRVAGIKKRGITMNGRDLVKMGFSPGPLFRKIIRDVNTAGRFDSRKQVKKYILDRYGN